MADEISRVKRAETNTQDQGGTGTKAKVTKLSRAVKNNPRKGGGINRALKSN